LLQVSQRLNVSKIPIFSSKLFATKPSKRPCNRQNLKGKKSNDEILLQENQGWIRVMMFSATFNNILVISWLSIILVEETGVPEENHRPVASR
jgi:hypothetical protein